MAPFAVRLRWFRSTEKVRTRSHFSVGAKTAPQWHKDCVGFGGWFHA
ncbi:hypothetical protein [Azospirillum doebereinerae]